MPTAAELYQQKLITPEKAVALVPRKGNISIGMRAATPPALMQALADYARAGHIENVRVYYMRCGKCATETIFSEDLLTIFHPYTSMLTRDEVLLEAKGYAEKKKFFNFVPISLSKYSRIISEMVELDTFLVTVAPMDKAGFFNFGLHGDYAIELSRQAKKLIVEVNANMPRTAGTTLLHVSEVDAIVENTCPLVEDKPGSKTELDVSIGNIIAPMIPDGATIQMGIGGIPNAICDSLTNHKDLGIHTEVLTPGLVNLIKKGIVTNQRKTFHRYQTVFTFAAGDRAMYDFIQDNPSMTCYAASHVNEPFIIGKNDNLISVNAFIEIDLMGQVNAEFLEHQFSGVGGQLDFVRGAYYSKGGKSILVSHSTTSDGKHSKIVPKITGVTTDTRLDVDYVVTEYGCRRLAGLSTTERTLALIELAHPNYKESLLQQAKELMILF